MSERRDPTETSATAGFSPMTETCAELGESPVWRAEDDMIWWVDVEGLRRLY